MPPADPPEAGPDILPSSPHAPQGSHPADYLLAFLSGGVLNLMVLCNGAFAVNGTALFSSFVPHATGTLAALAVLMLLPRLRGPGNMGGLTPAAGHPVPWWAWAGGLSGAVTVMFTSTTVNSPLALSGTLALGLAGQVAFGLVSDRFGWFGMPARVPSARDIGALALIVAGSLLVITSGRPA
jgi:transporter family-2 protein